MTPRVVHAASGREWRGGQRQTWLLARELERAGVEQVVVTRRESELARRLADAGVPVRGVSWQAGLDPRALSALVAEARRGGIVHAHDPHALALASMAARWTRAPVVVTRRVVFPLRRPGAWRRAAHVIAISDAVRARLLRDGVPPGRITVVPSGIDLAETRATAPALIRPRPGLAPGTPLAVSVAALTPEKDPAALLEAAARLREEQPGLRWLLAGEGGLRPELERRIAELELRDTVHLLGQIDAPLGLIMEADVFVLASLSEGLGSSLLDAMALGVPVVATRVGGIPEVVGEAGLLVPPRDPVALAGAVGRVLADGALRRRLAAAGTARIGRFDLRRMADATRAVYVSVFPDD